jgi:septal ring factor EnvC (AmiA/AmiB activator)
MRRILSLVFIGMMLMVGSLPAQTVKELEDQRKQALKRLETTNKVLNETKKNQRTALNRLNIIKSGIQERKKLINHLDKEISVLDSEISRLTDENRRLSHQLNDLKSNYAKMVREAYINRSVYARIMFVLSAETFDQSFRRLRYLQEYSEHRKIQIGRIEKTKVELRNKTQELSKNKQSQVAVKGQKITETTKLSTDQKKESSVLNELTKKEKTLRADLQKQQKIAADLNRKIERLIAEEIRKAEEKARAEERARKAREEKQIAENKTSSKEKTPTSEKEEKKTQSGSSSEKISTMTKEMSLLAGSFAANQGRLPWPVERGFISGRFGVQQHPLLKYVTTNNKGVYFQTPSGSNARAVFEGVVTQRFAVPGSNNGVIVQHGNYRTVYANLTSIYVSVGQKVSAKQSIGRIYTDNDNENKSELFFQIWKDRAILNPQSWITK